MEAQVCIVDGKRVCVKCACTALYFDISYVYVVGIVLNFASRFL